MLKKYEYYLSLPEHSKTVYKAAKFKSRGRNLSSKATFEDRSKLSLPQNERKLSLSIMSSIRSNDPKASFVINDKSKFFLLFSQGHP